MCVEILMYGIHSIVSLAEGTLRWRCLPQQYLCPRLIIKLPTLSSAGERAANKVPEASLNAIF